MTKTNFIKLKALIAFLFMYMCSTHGCIAIYVQTQCKHTPFLYCRLEVADLLLQFGAKPGKADSNNQV